MLGLCFAAAAEPAGAVIGTPAAPPPSVPSAGVADLMDAGHWKRARAIVEPPCRSALRATRCDFVAWSRIQLAFGDAGEALTAADKAIAIDSKRGEAYLARGRALQAQAGDSRKSAFERSRLFDQARKSYEQAIERMRKSAAPLEALALLYASASRSRANERRAAETAGDIEPIDPVAAELTRAAIFELAGKRAEAGRLIDQAVRSEPDAFRTNIADADFEAAMQRWPGAERAAQVAAKAQATRVAPYRVLALAETHERKLSELDAMLTEANREVPDDRSPEFYAASALIGLKLDLPRARRYLDFYDGQPPEAGAPSLHDAEKLRAQLSILTRAK
jgi:tetratricopeptide (TPR) repeat protein